MSQPFAGSDSDDFPATTAVSAAHSPVSQRQIVYLGCRTNRRNDGVLGARWDRRGAPPTGKGLGLLEDGITPRERLKAETQGLDVFTLKGVCRRLSCGRAALRHW